MFARYESYAQRIYAKTLAAVRASRDDVINWRFAPARFLVSISAFCKWGYAAPRIVTVTCIWPVFQCCAQGRTIAIGCRPSAARAAVTIAEELLPGRTDAVIGITGIHSSSSSPEQGVNTIL
jgi:hypothetical protein